MPDDRPVLVVTRLDDPTAEQVIAELGRRDVPVIRFDTADFPNSLSFSWTCSSHADDISGWLCTPTRRSDLSAVRSLYYRRPSGFTIPIMDAQHRTFATLQARYGLGGVLATLPGCLYVNHPHRIADAEFKPAQLAVARNVGFTVPPTLITNDAAEVRAFAAAVGRIVYKPLRLAPYTAGGTPKTVWVEEVDSNDIDDSVRHSAHMFQSMIEKVADLRVTVFGSRMFAVKITGGWLDFRYDYDVLSYERVEIPADITRTITSYLAHFGLFFGAFDFALGVDGTPWFLECNPNGQWAWLEDPTGLPMTAALADLLEKGLLK